ncbi:HAAS signaling domain-containing protein [Thermomonospora umbrina]|uniref:HAAS signaling domain-containing protein n=1 Tax=Thermomonospora umbrina TaxID=111806 RepID=UPI00147754D4|nr:hypothetical protein [Thermomonospora umbrina]
MTDALIDDYLDRLARAAAGLPGSRRAELTAEIREHIEVALAEGPDRDEAAVRTLLDRLGDPEDIAREAGAPAPALGGPPARRSVPAFELVTVLLLLLGGIVLPVLGWVVGVVLLWASARWSVRDKLLGTLVFPGGLAVAAWWLFFASGSSTTCDPTGVCETSGTSVEVSGAIVLVGVVGSLAVCAHLIRRARA